MRLFQSLRRHSRPLRETLLFRPTLNPLEDRLTPDSSLLGNPIVTTIGPVQSFTTYTNSTIDQPADIYVYQFQATAGYWFSAQTQPSAGAAVFATNLRLFDSTGQDITSQVGNNGPSTNVLLDTVIPATGTYYLGLAGGTNTAYDPTTGAGAAGGATGNYDLQMSLWQMTGTAGTDLTFTVTGAAAGGNQLEFYLEFPSGQATVIYNMPGDPNAYYAYNPTGVVNYRFNMGGGAGNQVVVDSPNLSVSENAIMYQCGAQISYGPAGQVAATVNVSGTESIYLYGDNFAGHVVMFDSPENNVFEGTVGYSAMTAASGSAQPYLNFAAGFASVTAQRYFNAAVDSAYFYASAGVPDGGVLERASPGSVTVAFDVVVNGADDTAPIPVAIANGFDSAVAYGSGQPDITGNRGPDSALFVDGPGTDVFYGASAYSYMSGPSPFIAGRDYFNEVFAFRSTDATSAGGGADTAYLLDAVDNTETGFANVITS